MYRHAALGARRRSDLYIHMPDVQYSVLGAKVCCRRSIRFRHSTSSEEEINDDVLRHRVVCSFSRNPTVCLTKLKKRVPLKQTYEYDTRTSTSIISGTSTLDPV